MGVLIIKKFGFWWWLIVIFLVGGIALIIYNLSHTYEFKKPSPIIHYESIRDNLTLNINNTILNVSNPCVCDNGSTGILKESGFNSSINNLWGTCQIIAVVVFIFVLLAVFGISDFNTSSWSGKRKGASMIAGIVSLTVVTIVFANVVMPTLTQVANTTMCVC